MRARDIHAAAERLAGETLRWTSVKIAACDGCTNYLEQMRATIELTGRLEADAITPAARETLLAAFRDCVPLECGKLVR